MHWYSKAFKIVLFIVILSAPKSSVAYNCQSSKVQTDWRTFAKDIQLAPILPLLCVSAHAPFKSLTCHSLSDLITLLYYKCFALTPASEISLSLQFTYINSVIQKALLKFHFLCDIFLAIFSSVQWFSRVQLFATPWIAARQAFLSITNSRSLFKLMPIESVMPSSHLILCHPLLLLPPIPPSIRGFSNESTFHMRWPKYWSFSFSISPSNEYPGLLSFRMDWLDLLEVQGTLKSLLQHHSSKASIFQHSASFTVLLSHPYLTTGKTIALTSYLALSKCPENSLSGQLILILFVTCKVTSLLLYIQLLSVPEIENIILALPASPMSLSTLCFHILH